MHELYGQISHVRCYKYKVEILGQQIIVYDEAGSENRLCLTNYVSSRTLLPKLLE